MRRANVRGPGPASPPTSLPTPLRQTLSSALPDVLPALLRPHAGLSVLDVTEWYGETSGGIRTYLDAKAQFVTERSGLRHTMVVPGAQDAIVDGDGARQYRLRGPRIPRHRPYRFMLAPRSLARIVRHERPDVIEVGSPFIVPWLVSRTAEQEGIATVAYYHTSVPGLFARRGLRSAALRYVHELYSRFALTLVGSQAAARDLSAAGVERVAHVPLGVDVEHFHPARRAGAADVRARWGLPEAPLVGFLGRFAREKALDVLLAAWPAIAQATGARLVLVGAGPLEPWLRAHPHAAHATILPFVTDRAQVADLLATLDLVVAPGPLETFGLAALEAIAAGTPVLGADCGGVAELVAKSGAGATFPVGNAAGLADAAIALLRADRGALGAAGRAYALAHHAWPAVFARLFDLYRSVQRA